MKQTFRGWWIVGVAFAVQAIAIGLTIIPFGLFTTPLIQEFDLSIASVQLSLGIFILVSTGASALVGPLLDRYSIRAIMALGVLLISLCFLLMSWAEEPWELAFLFSVGCALGISLAGPLSATTVIAKWFNQKRGLAVGIAAMGPPAGGLLLSPLAGWLLAEFGWRETLQAFSVIAVLLAPLAWMVVRNSPAEVGQTVDGVALDETPMEEEVLEAAPDLFEVLRNPNFWSLALAMGIVFGIGGGWQANVPRFGEDLGFSGQYMAALIGMAAGLGIPATLLFGGLADRFDNRRLLWLAISGQALGFLLLWTDPPELLFGATVLLMGFSGGGFLPLYASMIGRLFGPVAFGSVMGWSGIVGLPFSTSAPVVAGLIRDRTGHYEDALLLFFVAFGFSILVLWGLRSDALGARLDAK